MKSKRIAKNFLFSLFIFFCGFFSIAFSVDPQFTIDESDLETIENGDYDSVNGVIFRMRQIYKTEGNKQIVRAIPALIKRATNDLKLINDGKMGEKHEVYGEEIWALSVTGDERVKPVLLQVMVSPNVFSMDVAKGFLKIGHSSSRDILDLLKAANVNIKRSVAHTLIGIGEFDTAGTYFNENDKKIIQEEMLKLVKDEKEYTRNTAIRVLGYFGDKSTIPILTEIKNSDPYMLKNGIYFVRVEAGKAIDKITKR
jgi:hypothetical protein